MLEGANIQLIRIFESNLGFVRDRLGHDNLLRFDAASLETVMPVRYDPDQFPFL
jgi:hypothetical protein